MAKLSPSNCQYQDKTCKDIKSNLWVHVLNYMRCAMQMSKHVIHAYEAYVEHIVHHVLPKIRPELTLKYFWLA